MIVELGHTGLWVTDIAAMRDFYTRILGLSITDEDAELGIVFLSSRPDIEHHELILQQGRTAPPGSLLVHQLSWRVAALDDLLVLQQRFRDEQVPIQQIVTHGNALGIYFFDPEGNRVEVYWPTGRKVAQPFRKALELDKDPTVVLERARRLLEDDSPRF